MNLGKLTYKSTGESVLLVKFFFFYRSTLKKGVGLSVIQSVRHNLISTQYLENKSIEFHQILCMH